MIVLYSPSQGEYLGVYPISQLWDPDSPDIREAIFSTHHMSHHVTTCLLLTAAKTCQNLTAARCFTNNPRPLQRTSRIVG